MGDALELNPVILFFALFIGERVAGILGVFLSIPIAGMIALWIGAVREDPTSVPEEAPVPVIEPPEKS
jgi:predicted PurR-regulated permease PerM